MKPLLSKYDMYKFPELFELATRFDASQEDIDRLGQWLDLYDKESFNGVYYDAGDGVNVFPVYGEEDENGDFPLIGYEIR